MWQTMCMKSVGERLRDEVMNKKVLVDEVHAKNEARRLALEEEWQIEQLQKREKQEFDREVSLAATARARTELVELAQIFRDSKKPIDLVAKRLDYERTNRHSGLMGLFLTPKPKVIERSGPILNLWVLNRKAITVEKEGRKMPYAEVWPKPTVVLVGYEGLGLSEDGRLVSFSCETEGTSASIEGIYGDDIDLRELCGFEKPIVDIDGNPVFPSLHRDIVSWGVRAAGSSTETV